MSHGNYGTLNILALVAETVSRSLVAVLFGDPFAVMNTVGLVAFALVGSSKAIREEFDLFGIVIVGLAMAFAAGDPRSSRGAGSARAAIPDRDLSGARRRRQRAIGLNVVLSSPETHPVTLVSDAIGLAAFATAGAIVATEVGVSAFGVVAIATINAVGGGAFADILLDRAPFILFEDFYASCAVLGGSAYWVVGTLGATAGTAPRGVRGRNGGDSAGAVTYGWNLPTAQNLELQRK